LGLEPCEESRVDRSFFSLDERQLQEHLIAHQCLWGCFGGDGARPFTEGYGVEKA